MVLVLLLWWWWWLLLLLAMMQMLGRMVRVLVWSMRVRALMMLGILLLLRMVCLDHHHGPCYRAVACDFPRLKVVDGRQIVGVRRGDLARESSRPVSDAAGSVSDFVVLGVLLRIPRYAEFDMDVYMRPSPWALLVWRIHDGHCPPVGDHRRKENEYHGVGGARRDILGTLSANGEGTGDRGGEEPCPRRGFFWRWVPCHACLA